MCGPGGVLAFGLSGPETHTTTFRALQTAILGVRVLWAGAGEGSPAPSLVFLEQLNGKASRWEAWGTGGRQALPRQNPAQGCAPLAQACPPSRLPPPLAGRGRVKGVPQAEAPGCSRCKALAGGGAPSQSPQPAGRDAWGTPSATPGVPSLALGGAAMRGREWRWRGRGREPGHTVPAGHGAAGGDQALKPLSGLRLGRTEVPRPPAQSRLPTPVLGKCVSAAGACREGSSLGTR